MYHIEAMHHGDKMVENELREGNFSVDDFLSEAAQWENVVFGLIWRGPGSSYDASSEWFNKTTI